MTSPPKVVAALTKIASDVGLTYRQAFQEKCRTRSRSIAKKEAVRWLMKTFPRISREELSKHLGLKDHSSAIHYVRKIEKEDAK